MSNQDKIREEFAKEFDFSESKTLEYDNLLKIADFFLSHTIPKKDIVELIEGMRRKPTKHPIPCPDGNPGCLVYHCEMRLSEEDKKTNKVLDDLLAHPLLKEE